MRVMYYYVCMLMLYLLPFLMNKDVYIAICIGLHVVVLYGKVRYIGRLCQISVKTAAAALSSQQ